MNIVIAADKFKGSLDSFRVCDAIATGLQQSMPDVFITKLPLADGGEGLADVMAYYTEAKKISVDVLDPLFRTVQAQYLLSTDGKTAIIEMAKASGLLLLHPKEYTPLRTTTYGTGQLIKAAVEEGVSKIILGIGGSATNDAGIGMAAALGYRFLAKDGHELKPVGENLAHIQTIDATNKFDLNNVSIEVACDVTNHLTGNAGAARVYAPQKGATPEMVETLENGMSHFAALVKQQFGADLDAIKGGGAAGGMGAGCVFFLNAAISSGVEIILHYSGALQYMQTADVIITGEGKLDAQSLQGKLVHGVAALAKKYNKPVIALCGTLDIDIKLLQSAGVTAAFSLLQKPMSLEEAMKDAERLLVQTACNLGNILKINLE